VLEKDADGRVTGRAGVMGVVVTGGEVRPGDPIGVELPASVTLAITKTQPAVKGDTKTNAMKPAVLETGAEIQVPMFVEEGERVKVDTRSGAYMERVK